jgi:hypothetical protein
VNVSHSCSSTFPQHAPVALLGCGLGVIGSLALSRTLSISLRYKCDGPAGLFGECSSNAAGGTPGISTAGDTGGVGGSDPCVASELE